jgi:glycosyltransferase involved in cell wall biosynthesis
VEDGRTGLVAEESVEGLADALERLVADRALRQRLAAGALQRGRQRFDLSAQAAAALSFYEEVLGAPR